MVGSGLSGPVRGVNLWTTSGVWPWLIPALRLPAAVRSPIASLESEIARRRTFAIISHPDAGKTTMTEKLLLLGGAIQMAGTVKARTRWYFPRA